LSPSQKTLRHLWYTKLVSGLILTMKNYFTG